MNKQKNSFGKLRAEKRLVQEKLNVANKVVCMQIDEISSLINNTEKLEKANSRLNQRLEIEDKQKRRYKLRLIAVKQLKDTIYKNYIDDATSKNKTIFKYQLLSASLAFVCNALIALYFLK